MTKVVQILYSGLGGHGSVAFSLVDASRNTYGWTNSLIFFGIEPLSEQHKEHCHDLGIGHAFVGTRPGRAWLGWPALVRALARQRPDAIILHSVKAIIPCALYARRYRIPIVAVEHQANALKHARERWISRVLMRRADAIVVLTSEYRDELRRQFEHRWRENKVHVIANGVDTDFWAPSDSVRSAASPRVIGMASRMIGIKRQELLIDALARLCQMQGRAAWRLSLAGAGDTLDALRSKVQSLGLDDLVSFPGHLNESALRDWFGTLDVYAHASDGETLSTSILQALAMALPVVGSDVPGISNVLGEGGGVGLAVAQEPQAFADAFVRLRDDADLAASLGKRARALAVNRYSQSAMFRRYRDLLERLCAR
jgi:glycosyltransferase involved in cell wall biosynthesis